MMNKTRLMAILAALSMLGAVAQEALNSEEEQGGFHFGRLKVEVGSNYRHFKHVSSNSQSYVRKYRDGQKIVVGPNGTAGNVHYPINNSSGYSTFVPARKSPAVPGQTYIPLVPAGVSGNFPIGGEYYADHYITQVTGGNGDVSTGDCFSSSVSVSFGFWRRDKLDLSLLTGIQYFNLDSDMDACGNTVVPIYAAATGVNGTLIGNEVIGGMGRAKVELDLLSLDVGVRADYELIEDLSLFAACGPTFNYTDMSTKFAGMTKSSDELILGAFAETGIEYAIWGNIGIVGSLRYDLAFGKPSAGVAEQDLDGFGATLKLRFAF